MSWIRETIDRARQSQATGRLEAILRERGVQVTGRMFNDVIDDPALLLDVETPLGAAVADWRAELGDEILQAIHPVHAAVAAMLRLRLQPTE